MKMNLMALAVRSAFGLGLALPALAMTLDKTAYGKLTDPVKALYVEKDGGYALDVEGVEDTGGLKSALQKERDAVREQKRLLKELQDKYKDIDPDKVREMMESLDGDEDAKLLAQGKVKQLIEKHTEKMRLAHEKSVEELKKKYDGSLEVIDAYMSRVRDNAVRAAAEKAGVHAPAIDDVLLRAREVFDVDEEGNAVQYLDEERSQIKLGKDGKTPFHPAEWLESMKATSPHWFPVGNAGGGAHQHQHNSSGKRVVKRADYDTMSPADQRTVALDKNVQLVD